MQESPLALKLSEAGIFVDGNGNFTKVVYADTDTHTSDEETPDSSAANSIPSQSSTGTVDPYDSTQSVFLRQELISEKEAKSLFRVLYSSALLGAMMVFLSFVVKIRTSSASLDQTRPLHYVHTGFGILHLSALSITVAFFARRLVEIEQSGLKWSERRWRFVSLHLVQLICMLVMSIAYLLPNIYMLLKPCGHFDLFIIWTWGVRLTCWNIVMAILIVKARKYIPWTNGGGNPKWRPDSTLHDASWYVHWLVLLCWGLYQVLIIFAIVYNHLADHHVEKVCGPGSGNRCIIPAMEMGISVFSTTFCLLYALFYVCSARKAFVELGKRSYTEFRWTNIGFRYHFRIGVLMMGLGVLDSLLWYVNVNACINFVLSSFGFLPIQFSMAAFTIVDVFFIVPKKPGHGATHPKHKTLDNFKWTENRNTGNSGSCDSDFRFCFETAVKLHYWCDLVYEYDEDTGQLTEPFDLKTAMRLYDLESFEFLRSEKMDAHAVVAWSKRMVLVCFRGTYSVANVLADLQMWRVHHPPERRSSWRTRPPMVHKGFLDSWTASGLDKAVLQVLRTVVKSPEFETQEMQVLVAGHSLGGAVAQLAAFDIRRTLGVRREQIACYTFGCPRVGNHAFAWEYDLVVPHTWHVVNDLDAIARTPKLWFLYKCAGKRVVVNIKGDMIVDPLYMEFKFTSLFVVKVSVSHHLLWEYRRSLAAVASAQFVHGKGLPHHKPTVQKLLKGGHVTKLLGLTEHGTCDWNSLLWPANRRHLSRVRTKEARVLKRLSVSKLEQSSGDSSSLWGLLYALPSCVVSPAADAEPDAKHKESWGVMEGSDMTRDVEEGSLGVDFLVPVITVCGA